MNIDLGVVIWTKLCTGFWMFKDSTKYFVGFRIDFYEIKEKTTVSFDHMTTPRIDLLVLAY